MTTAEWVHKLNQLAAEIEDWMHAIHPSAWDTEANIRELTEKYRELARVVPDDTGEE